MDKHAYLILFHRNLDQLKNLIKLLDYEKNDIFIHIDKRNRDNFSQLYQIAKYSNVHVSKKIKVGWGSFSMVEAELVLLEEAVSLGKYSYYHLLSAEDLPLKNNTRRYDFFEKSQREFILFTEPKIKEEILDRVRYRHIFTNLQRISKNRIVNKIFPIIDTCYVLFEKILNLKRKTFFKEYQKGSQWFSITHSFACHVLKNKNNIRVEFSKSLMPDELFMQTLAINSKWRKSLNLSNCYNDCLQNSRYIDWNKGRPYTFKAEDYHSIINSGCCFARKFSMDVDEEIIKKISHFLLKDEHEKTE